jgi:hypothetical protein
MLYAIIFFKGRTTFKKTFLVKKIRTWRGVEKS